MKLQPLDLKQGEDFGYSVAACDITGDGRDDLIVGSPSYAEDQFHYNVGRLHVFVFDPTQNTLRDTRFDFKLYSQYKYYNIGSSLITNFLAHCGLYLEPLLLHWDPLMR